MAHPRLNRTTSSRAVLVGIAGAVILVPGVPALGQSLAVPAPAEVCQADALVGEVCDVTGELEALGAQAQPSGDVLGAAAAPLADALPLPAPPTSVVEDVVADVTGQLGGGDAGEAPGGEAPVTPGPGGEVPATPAGGQSGTEAVSADADGEPAKVEAAGKAPTTEVVEPQAPVTDGRVTGSPTIQPANLGANIPGVRSNSGLTLQPYDAPMVSIPMEMAAPQVAVPTMSTATPVQQAAVEAVRLTGETLVPYTSGAGAWITATGLGLMAAAGFGLRRRAESLTATTMDR